MECSEHNYQQSKTAFIISRHNAGCVVATDGYDTKHDIHKCLVPRHSLINSPNITRYNDNTRRLTDSDSVLKCSSPCAVFSFFLSP